MVQFVYAGQRALTDLIAYFDSTDVPWQHQTTNDRRTKPSLSSDDRCGQQAGHQRCGNAVDDVWVHAMPPQLCSTSLSVEVEISCTPNDATEQVGTTQNASHSCTSMCVMTTTCAMALIYNSVRTASRFVEMSAELRTFSDKKCVVTVAKASY